MIEREHVSPKVLLYAGLVVGLTAIVVCSNSGPLVGVVTIMSLPAASHCLIQTIRFLIVAFHGLLVLNYFITSIIRYGNPPGLSVAMDIGLFCILLAASVRSIFTQELPWNNGISILTIGCALWAIYRFLEVGNPTAVFEAWNTSRGAVYIGLIVAPLGNVLINRLRYVKHILLILSILALLASPGALVQKYIGFDPLERARLDQGGAKVHIIATGARHSSFFTDTGNLGSNMGMAGVVYGIITICSSSRQIKIYYGTVALLGVCTMFLSGICGTIVVPLGGLMLFGPISKKARLVLSTFFLGVLIYLPFAHTYIGRSNPVIRCMHTTFHPMEDVSFSVRIENKKRPTVCLKNCPFDEGLGLGGVEAQCFVHRVTTAIPHDSTYVKLWMETGIMGLCLHLSILIVSLSRAYYIVILRVRNSELCGLFTVMSYGVFGLMVSVYGNAFFGQFLTQIIVSTSLAAALNGQHMNSYIDKEVERNK